MRELHVIEWLDKGEWSPSMFAKPTQAEADALMQRTAYMGFEQRCVRYVPAVEMGEG